jgi:hypothetical protein
MLVIKNKILSENLTIERTDAIIPTDSIGRTSLFLFLNGNKSMSGKSLLNRLEPTEHCLDVLRWPDLLVLPTDEIKQKFYNPGVIKLPAFNQTVMTEDINP